MRQIVLVVMGAKYSQWLDFFFFQMKFIHFLLIDCVIICSNVVTKKTSNIQQHLLISPHYGIFNDQYWHLHGSKTFHCPYPGICSLSQHIKCNEFLPKATGSRASSECHWNWLMVPTLKTASIWPLCMDTCLFPSSLTSSAPGSWTNNEYVRGADRVSINKNGPDFSLFCPMMSRPLL